ncbi:MAG: NUDIX domain-containing protein [Candidatus Colwellbacteria bacterium]|nr:NUDIX domain-containing protein [Candidatus Colwellbacteria bacterium]
MAKVIYGERIGRSGKISTGCSAVIFDDARQKILLTRRADNNQWCLPSGRVEAGESITEACVREVLEETGLQIEVVKLIGVYSNPHQLIEYPDGNHVHLISLCFEVQITGGRLATSDETTEFNYFGLDEIDSIDLLPNHRERIVDAFAQSTAVFIR